MVLDTGCDWDAARQQLLALPGIGPWTAEVIAMRGLGDPDAFPASDLGLRLAAEQLGVPTDQQALSAKPRMAPLALVCHTTSMDHAGASSEPMAIQGGRMIHYRTMDSPIGPLALAGRGRVLTNLRMVDQTYEPNRTDWVPDDRAFPDAVNQLGGVFRRRAHRFRPRAQPGG